MKHLGFKDIIVIFWVWYSECTCLKGRVPPPAPADQCRPPAPAASAATSSAQSPHTRPWTHIITETETRASDGWPGQLPVTISTEHHHEPDILRGPDLHAGHHTRVFHRRSVSATPVWGDIDYYEYHPVYCLHCNGEQCIPFQNRTHGTWSSYKP